MQIGIIGGGIVGSTAAYYLCRAGYTVTLFDEGTGQATSAAAGIINPWFSLRRNKPWYFLVREGAEFYRTFMKDLEADGHNSHAIFDIDGALMIRRSDKRLKQDLEQADAKRSESPAIQTVKTVKAHDYFPLIESDIDATWVEGGGRVDGTQLIQTLHQAIQDHGGTIITEKASFTSQQDTITIKTETASVTVDRLLLAAGAWLPELLTPHQLTCDIFPQKGQLYQLQQEEWQDQHWPVIMPPGTADIIPFNDGRIIIGASHENEAGYDLTIDPDQLEILRQEVRSLSPKLADYPIQNPKVGTRAHTENFDVLVGKVPSFDSVWAISGLGSSGLTSGPYLGYQWAQLIQTGSWAIDPSDFPIESHITNTAEK